MPRVASGSSLSNAIRGSKPASRQSSRISPGEVADGPWTQASSRSPASSSSGSPASAMAARDDRVHRLLEQQPLLDVRGRLRPGAPEHHREVDVAVAQRVERPGRPGLADRDRGVGQPPPQVGDRERHEPGQRRRVAREPDPPLLVGDEVGDLDLGERQSVERGTGVLDQQPAGVGQLRAATGARDERSADLGLERGEVLRDRGLGERQRVGGGGQRAVVGDRAQRAQAPEVIHKVSLSNGSETCLR